MWAGSVGTMSTNGWLTIALRTMVIWYKRRKKPISGGQYVSTIYKYDNRKGVDPYSIRWWTAGVRRLFGSNFGVGTTKPAPKQKDARQSVHCLFVPRVFGGVYNFGEGVKSLVCCLWEYRNEQRTVDSFKIMAACSVLDDSDRASRSGSGNEGAG